MRATNTIGRFLDSYCGSGGGSSRTTGRDFPGSVLLAICGKVHRRWTVCHPGHRAGISFPPQPHEEFFDSGRGNRHDAPRPSRKIRECPGGASAGNPAADLFLRAAPGRFRSVRCRFGCPDLPTGRTAVFVRCSLAPCRPAGSRIPEVSWRLWNKAALLRIGFFRKPSG